MIRLWRGHYHVKGLRYCETRSLCAENENVWCARFTFAALWPLDGRWGSQVLRVICLHCWGASNLHTEPLCISKEPCRQPPVSDHYLGPNEGRLGATWKTANHDTRPPPCPSQYPHLPSTHLHFHFHIKFSSYAQPRLSYHVTLFFYPPSWITTTLSFSNINIPHYPNCIQGWYCLCI